MTLAAPDDPRAAKPRLRASAVCRAEGHLLLVRLRDPVSGVVAHFPPGGAVEAGETPAHTAARETLEETGLVVRVDPHTERVDRYAFSWAGVDYDVTTHYFAALLEDPFTLELPDITDASYHLGALWLEVDAALEALSVHPTIAASVSEVLRLGER